MSDITLNSTQRQPTVTDTSTVSPRTSQSNSASSTDTTATNTPSDSVDLSPAAQLSTGAAGTGSTFSDKDAEQASVGLRQSIGVSSLSVSAKQNQAILSLLR